MTILTISSNIDGKVNLSQRAQIAHLKVDETFTEAPSKYANITKIFPLKLTTEPPKHIGINNHAIELMDD